MKKELKDVELASLERAIFNDISRIPCNTSDRAKKFVAFAWRSLQGMPIGDSLTPFAMIQNRPVFVDGINLVERWLSGEPIGHEQFQDAHSAVLDAGMKLGAFKHEMTGEPAACWATVFLVEAAWKATGTSDWTNEAAGKANLAVRCAFQASRSRDAIEFIQARFGSIIGLGKIDDD